MTQDEFDNIVKNYNGDFHHYLGRASRRNYEGLLPCFRRLKDLYFAIVELQASDNYHFRVLPYPLSFRANDDLLKAMGFDEEGIRNIYGFLEFVKETEGRDFETVLGGRGQRSEAASPGNQNRTLLTSIEEKRQITKQQERERGDENSLGSS